MIDASGIVAVRVVMVLLAPLAYFSMHDPYALKIREAFS